MTDAPDPDVLEQSQVVEDLPEPEPPHLGNDVPEADALEQSQDVPIVDDDYGVDS